jgi:hypothetical protein
MTSTTSVRAMPSAPANETQIRQIRELALANFGREAREELAARYVPLGQMSLRYADDVIRELGRTAQASR